MSLHPWRRERSGNAIRAADAGLKKDYLWFHSPAGEHYPSNVSGCLKVVNVSDRFFSAHRVEGEESKVHKAERIFLSKAGKRNSVYAR